MAGQKNVELTKGNGKMTQACISNARRGIVGKWVSMIAWALIACACGSQSLSQAQAFLSHSPHPVSKPPSNLAISVADLPAGWSEDPTSTKVITSPRQLIGDSSDDSPYTKNGWVSAYEADFVSSSSGDIRVAILIDEFNDPNGAASFFRSGIGGQKGQHGTPIAEVPKLGQDSYVFRQQTQIWFYWIDRNIFVRVLVDGSSDSFGDAEAVDVAQRQASIISQA